MSKVFETLHATKRFRQEKQMPETIDRLDESVSVTNEDISGLSDELLVIKQPRTVIAENFRFLRSKLLWPPQGVPPRTIMITSALPGDGKTFVACNLAAAISQTLDAHVLLVDADLRKPQIHRVFGVLSSGGGLSDYLSGNTPLASVFQKTSLDKLAILPGGHSKINPVELVSSERMRMLIREVRDRYPDRFIVIDTPPIELAPESLVIANEVDAVLMVVRYGKTPRQAVQEALKQVKRENFFGVVFNDDYRATKYYNHYDYYAHKRGKRE